jgi:hypothetical protein
MQRNRLDVDKLMPQKEIQTVRPKQVKKILTNNRQTLLIWEQKAARSPRQGSSVELVEASPANSHPHSRKYIAKWKVTQKQKAKKILKKCSWVPNPMCGSKFLPSHHRSRRPGRPHATRPHPVKQQATMKTIRRYFTLYEATSHQFSARLQHLLQCWD